MRMLIALAAFAALTTVGAKEWAYDFDSADLADWTVIGGEWNLVPEEGRGTVLELSKYGDIPEEPVRRPGSLILAPAPAVGTFEMEVNLRTLEMEKKGADVILVFGYQDPTHYYYAHICNDSNDKGHHVIFKVEGSKKTRTLIDNETAPEPTLNGQWQSVRLKRTSMGHVEVYCDDNDTPTLTADDATWPTGRVGLGSFNDNAQFDELVIRTTE